jgi:cytochrome P450
VTSDGDRWRRDRRIVAPIFTRRRVAAHVDDMAGAARRLADAWRDAAAAGMVVDANAGAIRYTLDVLGRTVIGQDVEGFADLLERAVPLFSEHAARRSLSAVRLPASWPTPANRRANKARREVWAMVDGLVQQLRREPRAQQGLLSELLAARDPDTGEGLDDVAVRDQALTFLIAGHETSASALASALHTVGCHPDVQEQLRAEVTTVLGGGAVTDENIEELAYARQIINETLRLLPPVHTVVRRVATATSIGDHDAPEGRIVAVSVWGIHHNPAVWPDAERFDPGRFATSADGDEFAGVDRYAHLPFGGGPRGCIGHALAMNELVAGLAAVVATYRIAAVAPSFDVDVGVTLRPRGPVHLRLTPCIG